MSSLVGTAPRERSADGHSIRDELEKLRFDEPAQAESSRDRPGRWVWFLLIGVVGLVGAAALATWAPSQASIVVDAVQVVKPEAAAAPRGTLTGAGYVVTRDRYYAVSVLVPGRITAFLVEEGDTVVAGQELARLDDHEYRARVRNLSAAVEVARANLKLARSEFERGERLKASGVLAETNVDSLENRYSVAVAAEEQAMARLDEARADLAQTVLLSPSDGVVLGRFKEVGETVIPGGFSGSGDLLRIANTDHLRVEVEVSESDLSRIAIDAPARVTPDAYPDRHYDATVVKLYPQIDRQKGTLKVAVEILDPDAALLPDMSARVAFLDEVTRGSTAPRKPTIPDAALQRDGADTFVWQIADGRAQKRSVAVEQAGGGRWRVDRGLVGGEWIVVGSPPLMQDRLVRRVDEGP